MNPRGLVLIIAGVWVTCQVFGGDALKRMNIVKDDETGSSARNVAPGAPVVPPGGIGNI